MNDKELDEVLNYKEVVFARCVFLCVRVSKCVWVDPPPSSSMSLYLTLALL